MRNLKKGLALLLTALMLISLLPVAALAEESPADSVVYNLGSQEIKVGNDTTQAESTPWNYKLFDENGNYAIRLEDNAFFPYEVQFASGGVITVEWFETPESTVQVGGHDFSVYTEQNDDTKLSQIGVWIDGDYVAARPNPKTFIDTLIMPLSLLPLTTVDVNLDLSAYDRYQFANVNVSAILSGMTPSQSINGGAKVVWARLNNDNYQIITQADKIDLSELIQDYWSNYFDMELIVGSALQLDENNVRYIVRVATNIPEIFQSLEVYNEISGVRNVATFSDTNSWDSDDSRYEYFYLPKTAAAQKYYIGIELESAYSGYTVKAIEGDFGSAQAALSAAAATPALDVTGKIMNQTLTTTGTGYEISFDPDGSSIWKDFTLVFMNDAEAVGYFMVHFYLTIEYTGISPLNLRDDSGSSVGSGSWNWDNNDVQIYTCDMHSGNPADAEYYLILYYSKNGSGSSGNRIYVDKAVLGSYDTLAAAAGQPDIKDQLFPASTSAGNGYKANFSGAGKTFTIFAEDKVYKLTVKAVDSVSAPADDQVPNPGHRDIYFRVNGASELSQVYVLPYYHDNYYDMGYQTVFYIDDVPLSSLKPTFWTDTDIDVYSGHSGSAGTKQESGVTVADFSDGPVQYAVPAADGTSLKNYWVTFVKKQTGGAKLYVNGINGENGAEREVFLNNVYTNKHDIFIANVGDAPLTGLSVTLAEAQNIKLDPYWTVGGTNNDTLAAFDSTALTDDYSELANVAKIRLLPNGEGSVSGTLTIKADGQQDVVITLTGNAGNPRLTTTEIPEAVKFVPYAVQILQNNKYPWNTVTMRITSGSLPAGVELKSNGELYGVPQEAGTFNFRVQMSNSDSRFGSSSANYTLVVQENTDTNVNAQNDMGYGVITRIPDMTEVSEQVLVLEGPIDEFVDFWLNGQKLVKDADYTAEDGSTRITVRSQTFSNKGTTGTNTIAGEYRDANQDLKKGAQNFTVGTVDTGGSGGTGGTSDSTAPGNSTGEITVSTTVSNGVASASVTDASITGAIDGAKKNNSAVTIKADPKTATTIEIKLTKGALDQIANNNVMLTVDAAALGALTFDVTALKEIAAGSGVATDSVVISLTLIKKSDLTEAQQALVPDNAVIVKCSVTLAGKAVGSFGKGFVTLSVPFVLANSIKTTQIAPYFLNESNNSLELVMGGYNATKKAADLKLRHFSIFVVKTNSKQYEAHGGWYNDTLDWAAQRDLLDTYIVDGKINAAQEVSRIDFVTALMKALGIQPLASFTVDQFDDVSGENAAYIRTARELGIVVGVGNNKFNPDATAKRGEQFQIVYNLIREKITVAKDTDTGKQISDFDDADTVPEWLKPALSELLKLGIVAGDGKNLMVADGFYVGTLAVILQKMATIEAAA